MKYLSSPADIVIGGGAAGAGKSYALLLEPTRHIENPNFGAVIFRRTMPQVRNEGGLWDTSTTVYSALRKAWRPRPLEHSAAWVFPSGARVKFSHMQYEKDMYTWMGSQIPLIGFDELTHFLANQFWFMLTRNRSACGVRPYMRCTTNPQARGWVKDLVQWWIYPDDYPDERLRGFPIPDRDGLVRWVTRFKRRLLWGNSPAEVICQLPESEQPEYDVNSVKSLSFIGGTLADNQALTIRDPSYRANLLAQDETTAMQLLKGRWYAAGDDDELFNYNALQDIFSNEFVPGGEKYMTADIAMEGSDLFVVIVWDGWRATHFYVFEKGDGKQVLDKMLQIKNRHGVPVSNISFDSAGMGNYLRGWLKQAIDFRAGDKPEEDNRVKVLFENLKTQCAYLFAQKVKTWQVYVNMPDDDIQDRIVDEFEKHRKKGFDASNRFCMTKKDEVKAELGYSPDFFDALIQRAVFDLRTKRRRRTSQ